VYVGFRFGGGKVCSCENLEGCCVDVGMDVSWKLMMIYFECEEQNIYTVL
jgi:hypothetical protein